MNRSQMNGCPRHATGFTLIEVMIALLIFVIASAAVMTGIQNLDTANARTRTIDNTDIVAANVAALVAGDTALISEIGQGKTIDASAQGTDPLTLWWLQSKAINPFLEAANLAVIPANCAAGQACVLAVGLSSRPPYSTSVIQKDYRFQVTYQ